MLELVPSEVPVVQEAFRMRAEGAPLKEINAPMRAHGIDQTWRKTQVMLRSHLLLGEIRFGEMVNPNAHPAIIDRETFARVQRIRVPRGRKTASERLLARQGVLRCGTCGGRLSVGSAKGGTPRLYWVYKCSPTSTCPQRVAISAEVAEEVVVEQVRAALAGEKGRASAESHLLALEAELDRAQQALDRGIRALASLADEPATAETLEALQAARDEAQAQLDQAGGRRSVVTLDGAADWDKLTLDEQRALVRATVTRVSVAPALVRYGKQSRARARERLTVEMVGK